MGTGGIGNGVDVLHRSELMERSKALVPEDRLIVAKCIDTDTLEAALKRRDEYTTDLLRAIAKQYNTLGKNPTIQAKEAVLKEMRAILRIPEIR